jgi:hypothetical protein
MKPKPFVFTLMGAIALVIALTIPRESTGQSQSDEAALAQALTDVAAQQQAISDNQAKMEEKIAVIAEDVRVARIFASRAGGKTK